MIPGYLPGFVDDSFSYEAQGSYPRYQDQRSDPRQQLHGRIVPEEALVVREGVLQQEHQGVPGTTKQANSNRICNYK